MFNFSINRSLLSAISRQQCFCPAPDFFRQYVAGGELTLGDGGSLSAVFAPVISLSGLFSFFPMIGEVEGQDGEFVSASVFVSDELPTVPLPAAA
jgi:hypothetical protein